jgi:hypothetical protein
VEWQNFYFKENYSLLTKFDAKLQKFQKTKVSLKRKIAIWEWKMSYERG